MSEMIEKVAKALSVELARPWHEMADDRAHLRRLSRELVPGILHPYDINEPTKADMIEAARAAIEALRDPTEGMIEATFEFSAWAGEERLRDAGLRAWQAAIDHILNTSAETQP